MSAAPLTDTALSVVRFVSLPSSAVLLVAVAVARRCAPKGFITAKNGSCAARLSVGRFKSSLKREAQAVSPSTVTLYAPLCEVSHAALVPPSPSTALRSQSVSLLRERVCRRPARRRGRTTRIKKLHLSEDKCKWFWAGYKSTQDPRRLKTRLVWQGKK